MRIVFDVGQKDSRKSGEVVRAFFTAAQRVVETVFEIEKFVVADSKEKAGIGAAGSDGDSHNFFKRIAQIGILIYLAVQFQNFIKNIVIAVYQSVSLLSLI